MRRTTAFVLTLLCAGALLAQDARRGEDARQPVLRLVHQNPAPVITVAHPDAAGNKYGFEGGRVVKVGGVYQLFTSEMVGDPQWVKMKLGRWTTATACNGSAQELCMNRAASLPARIREPLSGRRCRSTTTPKSAGISFTSPIGPRPT